jgi:hypothetical protein
MPRVDDPFPIYKVEFEEEGDYVNGFRYDNHFIVPVCHSKRALRSLKVTGPVVRDGKTSIATALLEGFSPVWFSYPRTMGSEEEWGFVIPAAKLEKSLGGGAMNIKKKVVAVDTRSAIVAGALVTRHNSLVVSGANITNNESGTYVRVSSRFGDCGGLYVSSVDGVSLRFIGVHWGSVNDTTTEHKMLGLAELLHVVNFTTGSGKSA